MLKRIPNRKIAKDELKAVDISILYNVIKKFIPTIIQDTTRINKVLFMSLSFLAFKIAFTGFIKTSFIASINPPNKYNVVLFINFFYTVTVKNKIISIAIKARAIPKT